MNENHRLIKDVSNALNFYMERTRREEGFDLSGILRPGYDLNQFKFNKLFGYSTGYDTTMKKAFMPQLCLPKAFRPESEEIKLREKFYKDELKYHLRSEYKNQNRKHSRTQSQIGNSRSKSVNEFVSHSKNSDKKIKPKVPAGLLTIRSTHTPALTKREKLSMVNITSKIMSASSELCFQKEDILLMKNLADAKDHNQCYVKKSLSQSRQDEREKYERSLLIRQREYERHMALKNSKKSDFDDEFGQSPEERKNEQISITPINERSPSPKSDLHKKDTATEIEPLQLKKRGDKLDQLKDLTEQKDGDVVKYRVVIKTGERLGSSTEATIKFKLYGATGKSKSFKLKDSKTHKIPFRKGNTDVFDLEIHDISTIKAIHVGHSEKSIEYSWFIDYIGVEDQSNNIVYTFETPDWFSTTSNDGLTSRILFKKNSSSLYNTDSDSSGSQSISSSSSRSSSSRSKKSTSTARSYFSARRNKSADRKSKGSSNSTPSSLRRSSTPQSTRSHQSIIKKIDSDREITSRLSTHSKTSKRSNKTSSSVRDAENEISSPRFDLHESPPESRLEVKSISHRTPSRPQYNIFECVEQNRLEALKEILQLNPLDITKTDLSGRSLMILACENGFENIVKFLADNSDDLLSMDTPLGFFPVHICAQYNRIDCMKIMYDYGASLHAKTNEGNTPLHLAAENGHYNLVYWLVEANVNVSILNNNAEMSYKVAKKSGHIEIANYLAEPSGIETQIKADDYPISTLVRVESTPFSPFSRPDEPSPENIRLNSSRLSTKSIKEFNISNSRKSSAKSSSSIKKERKYSASSSTTTSSLSQHDSDSSFINSGRKDRTAPKSNIRLSSPNSLLNTSNRSKLKRDSSVHSNNKSKNISRNSSRNYNNKSPDQSLISNSSVSLERMQNTERSQSKNLNLKSTNSDSDSKSDSSTRANSVKQNVNKSVNRSRQSSTSTITSKHSVTKKKSENPLLDSNSDVSENELQKNTRAKSINNSIRSIKSTNSTSKNRTDKFLNDYKNEIANKVEKSFTKKDGNSSDTSDY